jgi:methylmalonyl-CoA mutase cobalamin-binding domain/chain
VELTEGVAGYRDALRDGDARSALRVVDDLIDSGVSFDELCEEVLRPALYEIGDLWENGSISVADEHLAAAISETVLACVGAISSAPIDAEPRVLVCSTEGEGHALGARMVGETLAAADWSVHYLGASVPAGDVAGTVVDRGVDVLALSTTMAANLPAAERTIAAARAAAPGVRVVVGGQAYGGDEETAVAAGADAFLTSVRGLTENVERLLGASNKRHAKG